MLPSSIYSQNLPSRPSLSEMDSQAKVLEALISTNSATRLSSVIQLDDQRKQLIGELMSILDSTNSDGMKMGAVVVLGKYKASEAVPFLVHHLEWEANMPMHDFLELTLFTPSNDEPYEINQEPVTGALCNIGMPAISSLLDEITQTDDMKISMKCVIICKRIEDSEVTQFRLQGLLEKEADPKRKERIESALDALKKLNTGK